MSDTTPRRVGLRALQLLPILALAVLGGVWVSVPYDLAPSFAVSQGPGGAGAMTRATREQAVDLMTQGEQNKALGLEGEGLTLDSAAADAWTSWVEGLPLHASRADVFRRIAPAEKNGPFARIAEWEQAHNARVWAWIVTGPSVPPLVASTMPEPDSLAYVEVMARSDIGQPTADGTKPPRDFTEWLWRETTRPQGQIPQFSVQSLQIGDHGGGGPSSWQLNTCTLVGGGQLYLAVVLGPGNPDGMTEMPTYDDLGKLDPTAGGFSAQLAEYAARRTANVWVFGPAKSDTYPLRVPQGATLESAVRLGQLVWPSLGIRSSNRTAGPVQALTPAQAALARATAGVMYVEGADATAFYGGNGNLTQYRPKDVAPQSVAFLATWDSSPAPSAAVTPEAAPLEAAPLSAPASGTAVSAWQRFVVSWFPLLFGGAVGFLALSLVVSPAAFAYERNLLARERARDELARLRRDAHDKVYNRLSALSKRIAASGEEVASHNAAVLETIAEDIRTTVGELQGILGEESRHADAALTSVPLADQLAAVCLAQSARLGIAATCDAIGVLPEVDARLGWDLQCIAEEAITNAVRHGGATRVQVTVAVAGAQLEMAVADNGSGSTVRSPDDAPAGSTGLHGATERLARWSGTLSIEPSVGGGTTVTARVPLGRV